jgi:hypothetical protein
VSAPWSSSSKQTQQLCTAGCHQTGTTAGNLTAPGAYTAKSALRLLSAAKGLCTLRSCKENTQPVKRAAVCAHVSTLPDAHLGNTLVPTLNNLQAQQEHVITLTDVQSCAFGFRGAPTPRATGHHVASHIQAWTLAAWDDRAFAERVLWFQSCTGSMLERTALRASTSKTWACLSLLGVPLPVQHQW